MKPIVIKSQSLQQNDGGYTYCISAGPVDVIANNKTLLKLRRLNQNSSLFIWRGANWRYIFE